MAGLTATLEGYELAALAAQVTTFSLHSGSAGTTGANELSGSGYARQAASWAAPVTSSSPATVATNTAVTFSVPAAASVQEIGYWNGSTFLGSRALTGAPITFGSAGQLVFAAGAITESVQ